MEEKKGGGVYSRGGGGWFVIILRGYILTYLPNLLLLLSTVSSREMRASLPPLRVDLGSSKVISPLSGQDPELALI